MQTTNKNQVNAPLYRLKGVVYVYHQSTNSFIMLSYVKNFY